MSTATVGQLTRSALKHAPSEADANANESWAAAPAPAGHSNEWPEPLPLEGELPQVMAFDERLLPESLRPLVCDVADRMQVPLDFPAAVMLLTLAGTVGRRARIQPKAVDSSWIVVPNMWGGIVAPPGQLKSPVITAMTAPLRAIEREWRGDFANAEASHGQALEEHKLAFAAWKELYKRSKKKGGVDPTRPDPAPASPTMRRLIVNDATGEALHEIMGKNPGGIFVVRDELTGWLSQLERAGREGERAFALSAWNGDTEHTIDRIGRGHIYVPHCCMSLLGGIQPSRLRVYLADALADGPSNDGLMQRLQVTVWPDTFTGRYVDRAPDPRFSDKASDVFARLAEMDPDTAPVFRFEPKAQSLFEEWYQANDAKAKDPATHPAMSAHLAKYRSLMPSIALLFELVDGDSPGEVSLQHAVQAAHWCDYLESHAGRIYSCITSPHMRAARELGAKIKAREIGKEGAILVREVYRKGWLGLDTPDMAKLALETLADMEWVRKADAETAPAGGRPAGRYLVNPQVWE